MNITKMNLDDLNKIKNTLISDFDDFWSYKVLEDEIISNNSHFFVYKNNDEIIGFAGIKTILDEADIMNIVVKKDCRKAGIGSSLLAYLIQYCKDLTIKTINLEVDENNISAICLYKKYGFEDIYTRKHYYPNGNNALVMKKII